MTGYTEYVESEDRENGITRGEDVTVPYHISKAACYVEDARDGRCVPVRLSVCLFVSLCVSLMVLIRYP